MLFFNIYKNERQIPSNSGMIFNERKDRKNHLYRKSKNLKIELKVITISEIPITS